MLTVGLLGYGAVGQSTAALIAERSLGLRIKHILRRPGKADDPLMTDDADVILNDPEVDVVVDALPGAEPSGEYIRRALLAGKAVVTANKAALASRFAELTDLARERNVPLLFEASCGGGIPWIVCLQRIARTDHILAMRGILNGTCNFILDRMERFGADFDETLREAQALGYAEADPAADIDGHDAARKAMISATVAAGAVFAHPFPVLGIRRITRAFMDQMHAKGLTVRHMMLYRCENGRAALAAVPVAVPLASIEGQVRENYNLVTLEGDIVGRLTFHGQGAGGRPTADAILQDLMTIRTCSAEPARSSEAPAYDAGLLRGTGHFPDESLAGRTLEELVQIAQEKNVFMAFQPEN